MSQLSTSIFIFFNAQGVGWVSIFYLHPSAIYGTYEVDMKCFTMLGGNRLPTLVAVASTFEISVSPGFKKIKILFALSYGQMT